ncbi:MAG: hypothetical protein HY554_17075 [Elusimicrobia bacterium]|nr:hypothetical protein [Elusimicrobiota bacterium]
MIPESTAPWLAALAGFAMGLQHALDADHVVAVSAIVAQTRRASSAWAVGALWGAGHTATLMLAGAWVLALKTAVPDGLAAWFEGAVGAAMVLVGALAIRDGVPRAWGAVEHEHEHGHDERHGHHLLERRGHSHPHLHLPALEALAAAGAAPWRSFGLGMVHGLAGSSALSLPVLAAMPGAPAAVAYLLVYGLGTLAGMSALTFVWGYSALRVSAAVAAGRWLAPCAGAASVAFGVVLMGRLAS